MTRTKAVLCDLFDTVVRFDHARLPTMTVGGRTFPSTTPLLLPLLRSALGDPPVEACHAALLSAWRRAREEKLRETPAAQRFSWAIEALTGGAPRPDLGPLAEVLAAAHADAVCAAAYLPPANAAALDALAAAAPLALVSNFDHGPAARALILRLGLDRWFSAVVISAEVGWRKPHPLPFTQALDALGIGPADALFVGDSLDSDVAGAQALGLRVAWIGDPARLPPSMAAPPDWIVPDLAVLPGVLGLERPPGGPPED